MTGRLRSVLDRPIADRDRQRAFAAAAVALLAAAAGLSLTATPPTSPVPAAPAVPGEPATSTGASPGARPGTRGPDALPGGVEAVARRFLAGYLARLYGHRSPRRLEDTTRALRRQLTGRPVRVAPGMRARRPRIVGLDGQPTGGGWLVRAEIADGHLAAFPVSLVIAGRPGGSVVTRVVED